MNCPECDTPQLLTTETFQLPDKTIRTKKCRECKYTFTSYETISEEIAIPRAIRDLKSKRTPKSNILIGSNT